MRVGYSEPETLTLDRAEAFGSNLEMIIGSLICVADAPDCSNPRHKPISRYFQMKPLLLHSKAAAAILAYLTKPLANK